MITSVVLRRRGNGVSLTTAMLALALIGPSVNAQTSQVTIQLPGYGAPILLDTLGTWRDLPSAADNAYAALLKAYEALMIPLDLRNATTRTIGNTHLRKMRSFAGGPMSRLVECGSGMTGPNADSYRIHLAVASRIEATSDTTSRVRSAIVAGGEDIMGSSTVPVPCGSTGGLEAKIHDVVLRFLRQEAGGRR